MAASLKSLELEDFKTYYGKHVVGPFKSFTGIVGPNGGGKSNLMDAVAFVLGERMSGLRVKHLWELIHRERMNSDSESDTDAPPPSASVTATFTLRDGGERAFQRVVTTQGSTFLVEGESVSWGRYQKELKKVGINTICRNFMVFQGTIESIATLGSRMKTELFEEISGSGALAQEYKSLKDALTKAEEALGEDSERHRIVMGDLKECRMDIKKEKEYKALEKECERNKLKLQLFRLFHIEKGSKSHEEELQVAEQHIVEVEEKSRRQSQLVEEKVEKHGLAVKDVTTLDHRFENLEMKLSRRRTEVITAKELLAERKRKEESCLKMLSKAREGQEAQLEEIRDLEKELKRVEVLAARYEEDLSQESTRMGTDIQLEDEQLHEYHRLKYEAAQRCVKHQQKLSQLSRQHKMQHDILANEERRISEERDAMQRKGGEVKEAQQRADRLKEKLRVLVQAQVDKSVMLKEYKEKVAAEKEKSETLKKQLVTMTEELNEAVWDESQAERQRQKQELVEMLHNFFPGIYGRLSSLCQPIHERYKVAITRVLLKHMDSIVVDTEATARKCIQYMTDKRIGRETFLPLNYLQPRPVRESLRSIQEPQHVKLAFDLLKFEQPNLKVAVLFATKDTLVCETPEDAMTVAYHLPGSDDREKWLSAVALDGTFYSKSGLVSGGKVELEKKAKRWGEKNLVKLKNKRNSLLDELRTTQNVIRKESEMKIWEAQLNSIEVQIKYIALEQDKILKSIEEMKEAIEKAEAELEKHTKTQKEMEAKLAEQDMEITEIQTEMDGVENEVFASFCEEIHIPNIRLYEEQGLKIITDRANRRLRFEKQKSRIQSQIEYEKSRDKEGDVEKWEAAVKAQRSLVKEAEVEERKKVKEAEKVMKEFAEGKAKRIEKEKVVRMMEEEVAAAQETAKKIRRENWKVKQKTFFCKQKIGALKVERHNTLKQCYIKGLPLPLKSGSLQHKSLREGTPISSSVTHSSSSTNDTSSTQVETQGSESEIRVNFSALPNAFKTLEGEEHQKKVENLLQDKVKAIEKTLSAMQPPGKNADEKLEQATEQMRQMKWDLGERQLKASNAKRAFEEVKQQRKSLFMDCFSSVAAKIDQVYKGLCQSDQAQALLETSNPEEPYLSNIVYHCIPPGKRCQAMWSLSGGEKSVAALAFLFALHSHHPAPFFLLDEVDAALDKRNLRKVSEYMRQQRQEVEMLVISHRLDLYCKADALFGVTCDMVNDYTRTKLFSLDLTQYRREGRKRQSDERHSDGRQSEREYSNGRQSDRECSDGRQSERERSDGSGERRSRSKKRRR